MKPDEGGTSVVDYRRSQLIAFQDVGTAAIVAGIVRRVITLPAYFQIAIGRKSEPKRHRTVGRRPHLANPGAEDLLDRGIRIVFTGTIGDRREVRREGGVSTRNCGSDMQRLQSTVRLRSNPGLAPALHSGHSEQSRSQGSQHAQEDKRELAADSEMHDSPHFERRQRGDGPRENHRPGGKGVR
jgi:hypothetical protein